MTDRSFDHSFTADTEITVARDMFERELRAKSYGLLVESGFFKLLRAEYILLKC